MSDMSCNIISSRLSIISVSSTLLPAHLLSSLLSLPSLSPLSPLSLPSLSPLSPLSLPSLSPLSPLSLPSLSPLSPLSLPSLSPLSPLSLPSLSPLSPLSYLFCIANIWKVDLRIAWLFANTTRTSFSQSLIFLHSSASTSRRVLADSRS